MKSVICPKCFARPDDRSWARDSLLGAPICPECGFLLLEDSPESAALLVTIAGAAGCGKSHYLAVLVDELKTRVAKAYNCALYALGGDDTLARYRHDYYEPLFLLNKTLAPTAPGELEPLIYSLVFRQGHGKTIGLALYDSCGESFGSIAAAAGENRSLHHSGGILFLVDPVQLPVAAEQFGAPCGPDPSELLMRIVAAVRTGSGQKDLDEKLDIPLAICISKLDTVSGLLDVSSFVAAPSRSLSPAGFSAADLEACGLEVKSLLECWGGGELISQAESQFSSCAFFGVSALGAPPENGSVPRIAPHRVSDPLLWLLKQKNAI